MSQVSLKVEHLSKSFGNSKVLEDVNFELMSGHILGLLGRNGAGKTTLMKSILGYYPDYKGIVCFGNQRLTQESKKRIGSLVQISFYEDLTAKQNLKYLSILDGVYSKKETEARIDELLEMVDLLKDKSKKVKSFSFGMRQRLALAQSFMNQPELLILDEPFVGLDPLGIYQMKEMLRNYCRNHQTSIVFSSHQIADFEGLVDEVMLLKDGRITLYDTYENIMEREGSLLELFK